MSRLAVLALLLAAAPALAQAPTSRTGSVPPSGAGAADAAPTSVVRGARTPAADDPLAPHGLRRLPVIATPRLGRGFDEAAPRCRSACASRHYACASGDEAGPCAAQWSQCLVRCSTLVTSR